MPDISLIAMIGAAPMSGVVCSAYKASRFGALPVPYDTAPPGGAADATATSGNGFGGPGQVSLTVPTFEEYWVGMASGGHIGWVKSPSPVVPESDVTALIADLALKALDSAVVHTTGTENIAGAKTFTDLLLLNSGSTNRITAVAGGLHLNASTGSISFELGGGEWARLEGSTGAWIIGGRLTVANDSLLSGGLTVAPASGFSGAAAGLFNAPTGFAGNLLDLQVNAVSQFNVDAAGNLQMRGHFYPATPALAKQTAAGISAGTGVPSNADGSNGDIYFRSDGGAATTMYQKRAGAWVATAA